MRTNGKLSIIDGRYFENGFYSSRFQGCTETTDENQRGPSIIWKMIKLPGLSLILHSCINYIPCAMPGSCIGVLLDMSEFLVFRTLFSGGTVSNEPVDVDLFMDLILSLTDMLNSTQQKQGRKKLLK